MEEGDDFGTWFQRAKSTSWQGGVAARGQHCGEGRRLTVHIFNHKQRQRANWECGGTLHPQSPPSTACFFQQSCPS